MRATAAGLVMMGILAGGMIGALFGATRPALAQQGVAVETSVNGTATVALYLHPFLTAQEVATLRLVATDAQALSLFVTTANGHAAMALSPDEGFVDDGSPVASAVAISGLPDAAAAWDAALNGCNTARKTKAACVVVLEVTPAP